MRASKALSLLLCVLLLAACGDGPGTGSGSSGARGRVVAGPGCPVEQEGSPCPPVPFEGEVQATDPESGDVVAATATDAEGRFQLALDPGTYELFAVSESRSPGGVPSTVQVQPGAFTQVTLTYDTGIR